MGAAIFFLLGAEEETAVALPFALGLHELGTGNLSLGNTLPQPSC